MKTILYMGITPNGYIAKEDGNSEWTSREDLQGFFENSKKAGNIIMGKNTYHEASKQGYFPFPEVLNVVVSHTNIENRWRDKVVITNTAPKDILKMLSEKGFDTAFLAGGGALNASFMREKLINEIYLDIEPVIFGKGIQVIAPSGFEYELELLEVKNLNKNTVQLHYLVK